MAKRRTEANGNSRGRRDFARFLLMLLPGFMFLGLLAPAAVTVKPKAQEQHGPVSFHDFTPRQPVYAPRGIEARQVVVADAVIEPLFSGARYVALEARRAIELPAVEAAEETHEEIVLAREEGVDDYVSDTLFDQSMNGPVLAVDLKPVWDPALFDRIPGPLSTGGYSQWDDFHGNGVLFLRGAPPPAVVIPEPETGALLALGLVALALRARKASKLR